MSNSQETAMMGGVRTARISIMPFRQLPKP